MSTKKARTESKFMRYIKGPVKILARARDLYVRSMTSCAGHAAVGVPNLHFQSLPRSFSANSSYSDHTSRDDDLRELIRVASTRRKAELLRSSPMAAGGVPAFPRSRTVTVGRIDEDKPCEFGGDGVGVRPEVYLRSKTYAPSRSSMV
ncbi:uncharacterized protein LOC131021568 [Salvia miltiorrhiza]|uniref:uncharacterized protein LOC131021568 n=1 Tax=Salvia miltiorrhiza TaxID=226208 RepID=UPI0025ABAB3E|nr:uncharacterized protein LOC131021568 [Salvia miltiorrhiza]